MAQLVKRRKVPVQDLLPANNGTIIDSAIETASASWTVTEMQGIGLRSWGNRVLGGITILERSRPGSVTDNGDVNRGCVT